MSKNITLNSTDEEKKEALDRQRKAKRSYDASSFVMYFVLAFFILLVIILILDSCGVTCITWYSRLKRIESMVLNR